MATATEDPIVAVYPVPGEIDPGTEKIAPLAPTPVRLSREDAEKAVKRGAFSYVDPTFADRKEAAAAARPVALTAGVVEGKGPSKAELAAAVKAAVAEATKEQGEQIAELQRQLAETQKPA